MTQISERPPSDFEDLTQAIRDQYDSLSKTYQKVAHFVTQNPNDVAMLSVNALSARCGVHASSLVRFAQQFGFKGFKELQAVFQSRLATAAPSIENRIETLKGESDLRDHEGMRRFLGNLALRDIAALERLIADVSEEDLVSAVDLLAQAETIYLLGQLRSDPVVNVLRYILTMLEQKVIPLDGAGGLTPHTAKIITRDDLLLAVSFRPYAPETVDIVTNAAACGVPIISISDSSLSPLAKVATVFFTLPEDEPPFSQTLAAPICLAQALMIALASRLQNDDADPRIPVATEGY